MIRTILTSVTIGFAGLVLAADADTPDAEFLEYLGLWETSDEEWLMQEQLADNAEKEQNDETSDDDQSMEQDNES